MTSRLKHKLELENVNLKSAYLNESFVLIGTPLPALGDHKKDKQEYLPVWEQEGVTVDIQVRDEQGRRRFHGAFTGGFSAGYFNTAGSKEGWTPSTFKSSRTNRATKTQRPEDFMDEEDLAAMREDRRLENTDTFRSEAGVGESSASGSLSSALESMVVPAKTSIGTSLLQKLGWRPGQGIGPRVTLRQLRRQDSKLGWARVEQADEEGGGDEASKHTFAPRDTKLLVYDGKDDKEGLGYVKGSGMGRLPGKRPTFGIAMDDDDDAYGESSAPQYVFDGMDDGEDVVTLGAKQPGKKPQTSAVASTNTWHDGRPIMKGFTLDVKGVPPDTWFPFPDVPEDWRPRPARVWGTMRKFDDAPVEATKEVVRGAPGKPLTHGQRGEALGEEPKTSASKSVFEFMSEKDRERLAAFAAMAANKTAPRPTLSMDEPAELPPERATEVIIPPLSPRTASSALQGYMPYTDDAAKQDRYRSYLQSQTYNSKHPNPTLLPSTSIDEVNKELEAFASSARIFKPMAFAMSSRFTSGSAALASSDMQQAKPGLHLYDAAKAAAAMEASKAKQPEDDAAAALGRKKLTPREQAAADGMYGRLTREARDWRPVKLVCKRFHVADPYPGAKDGDDAAGPAGASAAGSVAALPANDASWQSGFIHQEGTERDTTPPPAEPDAGERAPRNLGEVGMGDDSNQGRDTLTYTKPSIDIFKAIFASDDEEDDDDDEAIGPSAGGAIGRAAVAKAPVDPFPVDDKPVDYTTFKPVFHMRRPDDGEADKTTDSHADKGRDKDKEKKKGKKMKRKGVLSFDVGDDGDDDTDFRERKRRPKDKAAPADTSEGVWVEKVASASGMEPAHAEVVVGQVSVPVAEPRAGRRGAADFM